MDFFFYLHVIKNEFLCYFRWNEQLPTPIMPLAIFQLAQDTALRLVEMPSGIFVMSFSRFLKQIILQILCRYVLYTTKALKTWKNWQNYSSCPFRTKTFLRGYGQIILSGTVR